MILRDALNAWDHHLLSGQKPIGGHAVIINTDDIEINRTRRAGPDHLRTITASAPGEPIRVLALIRTSMVFSIKVESGIALIRRSLATKSAPSNAVDGGNHGLILPLFLLKISTQNFFATNEE